MTDVGNGGGRCVTRVSSDIQAEQRLRELDLTLDGLIEVVRRGEFARAEATPLDPTIAGGWDAYRHRVRGLREVFGPTGWTPRNDQGVEMALSPCRRRAIITRSGDAGVGLERAHPQPVRAVGETLGRAVSINSNLLLDPNWMNTRAVAHGECETWMLLVTHLGQTVRSELSLPSETSAAGDVLGWTERILLPEIDLDGVPPAYAPPVPEDGPVIVRRR